MLNTEEKCITDGFVMPPWQKSSFPLLAIARQYDLDYGDVCVYADVIIKRHVSPGCELPDWEQAAAVSLFNSRFFSSDMHDAIEEVALRMPRARRVQ